MFIRIFIFFSCFSNYRLLFRTKIQAQSKQDVQEIQTQFPISVCKLSFFCDLFLKKMWVKILISNPQFVDCLHIFVFRVGDVIQSIFSLLLSTAHIDPTNKSQHNNFSKYQKAAQQKSLVVVVFVVGLIPFRYMICCLLYIIFYKLLDFGLGERYIRSI